MTNIVLLDGGLGQELVRRSEKAPTPMWMAQAVLDDPDLVVDAQRSFVDAGSTVLTLASYSSTPERLARDASADLFEPLQMAAIEAARRAVEGTSTKIAGCLPPLVGSYRPELAPDEDECLAVYGKIVALQNDAVDVFQCETMSSIKEVRSSVTVAAKTGKAVWCGISVDDADGTKLRSGEALDMAIQAAVDAGAQAVLINCSKPEAINQAMPILKASGVRFGAYANAFTSVDALGAGGTVNVLEARQDLGPDEYADIALNWVDQGAEIIGGCCEVGPDHINVLAKRLQDNGHNLVGEL